MFNFLRRKKFIVTLIDNDRNVIKTDIRVKNIPRVGELMFFEEGGEYFIVTKIVHYIADYQCVYVVIEKISKKNA